MLRHKNIEHLCLVALAAVLAAALLVCAMASAGLVSEETGMDYAERLFDQSRVHTIDITMDDWDGFLEKAVSEEYADCQITIDGEIYKNVAIRAKGNTSLSSVQQYGNDRYSFKVEFDHYQNGMTYHGLDKLSLNNLIQDNTYLKDYTAYTLMGKMGVAAPLCSFVQITVNGEPWGLYLAVEGVEDSFLARNYGKAHGELYKPDSISFGGGRGNGREFDADKMMEQFSEGDRSGMPSFGEMPDMGSMPEMPSFGQMPDMTSMPEMPPSGTLPDMSGAEQATADGENPASRPGGGMPMGGFGGMGSSDVKLVYTDDNPESYANIFDNAKTDISEADQQRLIASLKALGEGDTSVINTDSVIRYMAVHNFLCNDDSYTGMMIHNYYLYEEDGVMEMIPWDYNLAMGGFSGSNATSTVNTSMDDLVSMGGGGDRPMADWILADADATEQYHAMYQTFMDTVFSSGWFEAELTRVIHMISPYVKDDPTAFCTYEEFETATQTLLSFCMKRAESIQLQLSGELAATSAQQDTAEKVDASELKLSAMGSMGSMGGAGGKDGGFPRMPNDNPLRQTPGDGAGMGGSGFAESGQEKASSGAPVSANAAPFGPGGSAPPDLPAQESKAAANSTQAIILIAISAATLLAAVVFARRSKTHS